MNKIVEKYISLAFERMQLICQTQAEKIQLAGEYVADGIKNDRLLYVFGAGGHTSLVVGEMFFRIGGLANVVPIVEFNLTALSRARGFISMERKEGLGTELIDRSGITAGDVLLLFHTIGVNAVCIEAAKEAKRLGAKVIGVASDEWQDKTPQDAVIRDVSGDNLRDIVDIYINDCNTIDDAAVTLPKLSVKAAPLSGIGSFSIAHMIELAAIEKCLNDGVTPPVWANANTPEGEARNAALMEKYSSRISML